MIAGKFDLSDRREVSTEQGEALAHQLGIPYLETSSMINYNISEAFETIIRMMLNKVRIDNIDILVLLLRE